MLGHEPVDDFVVPPVAVFEPSELDLLLRDNEVVYEGVFRLTTFAAVKHLDNGAPRHIVVTVDIAHQLTTHEPHHRLREQHVALELRDAIELAWEGFERCLQRRCFQGRVEIHGEDRPLSEHEAHPDTQPRRPADADCCELLARLPPLGGHANALGRVELRSTACGWVMPRPLFLDGPTGAGEFLQPDTHEVICHFPARLNGSDFNPSAIVLQAVFPDECCQLGRPVDTLQRLAATRETRGCEYARIGVGAARGSVTLLLLHLVTK